MLPDKYTAVLQAQDREAFLREIVSFTKRLGFDTIGATVVLDQVGAEPRFVWVDNAPLAYRHIADDFKRGRIDPVSQHCKRASVPIVWDQKTYTSAGLGPLWEEQAPFGYCTGIALALHLPSHALAGSAGEVTHLSGAVMAQKADGQSRILSVKSNVEEGDVLAES